MSSGELAREADVGVAKGSRGASTGVPWIGETGRRTSSPICGVVVDAATGLRETADGPLLIPDQRLVFAVAVAAGTATWFSSSPGTI